VWECRGWCFVVFVLHVAVYGFSLLVVVPLACYSVCMTTLAVCGIRSQVPDAHASSCVRRG